MKSRHTVDMRKIRHAVVLAAERNFVRAAAKLAITQSALSHSIARLEADIGLVLFDRSRSGEGVQLTSAGKEFVERAEDLLVAEGGLLHELALMREGRIGRIAFGFSAIPADVCLAPVMAGLVRDYPALQVHVELTSNTHLLHLLQDEQIEFFVADTGNIRPGKRLAVRQLGRVHVGFYARAGHPLLGKSRLRLADLQNYPLLTLRAVEGSYAKIRYWLRLGAADPLPGNMICDDLATLARLTQESDALLLGPHCAVSAQCDDGRLVELPLTGLRHKGYAGLCVVSLAKRSLSPPAKMIIGQVEALLGQRGLQRRAGDRDD